MHYVSNEMGLDCNFYWNRISLTSNEAEPDLRHGTRSVSVALGVQTNIVI